MLAGTTTSCLLPPCMPCRASDSPSVTTALAHITKGIISSTSQGIGYNKSWLTGKASSSSSSSSTGAPKYSSRQGEEQRMCNGAAIALSKLTLICGAKLKCQRDTIGFCVQKYFAILEGAFHVDHDNVATPAVVYKNFSTTSHPIKHPHSGKPNNQNATVE